MVPSSTAQVVCTARSRNSRSWLMMMTVQVRRLSQASSQMRLSMSRWLVGSSKSSSCAGLMRQRAKARRLRQPPENSRTVRFSSPGRKPRPFMIVSAWAFTAPSLISARCAAAAAMRMSSPLSCAATCSAWAAASGAWPSSTYCNASRSVSSTLCATSETSSGTSMVPDSGLSSPRMAAKSDDLPLPFSPTSAMRSPSEATRLTLSYSVRVPRTIERCWSLSMETISGREKAAP